MMESLFVELTDDLSQYQPGSQVHGQLRLTCSSPTIVHRTTIQFHGLIRTEWKLSETYLVANSAIIDHVPYAGRVSILHPRNPLELLGTTKFGMGSTRIPFTLTLPSDIPPSFENNLGFIRYWIKAIVQTEANQLVETTPIELCTGSHYSTDDEAPVRKESRKETFFKHRQLSAVIQVQKPCFTIGDQVEASVEVVNEGEKAVHAVQLQLVQFGEFRAHRDSSRRGLKRNCAAVESKRDELVVKEWTESFHVGRAEKALFEYTFRVPEVAPSFDNCDLVKINYVLRAQLLAQNHKPMLTCDVPVHISSMSSASSWSSSITNLSIEIPTEVASLDSPQPIITF